MSLDGSGSAKDVQSLERPSITEELELELLIREARRRHRRRRRIALFALLAAAGLSVSVLEATSETSRPGSLLARPLHFPTLGPGGRCPVSPGYTVNNSFFGGDALGKGPVRVLIVNGGDVVHGHPQLGTTEAHGWFALKTLWFAMPGYNGPFVVRGARLGKPGPIKIQPGGEDLTPGSEPLVVPAGPTINSYPPPTMNIPWTGYRTVPGSTWVKSPGCYAWQIDGLGFSEVIVVYALAAGH
jgi:hypothetical protein